MFKADKEKRRLEVRLQHLQKLKEATKRESREAARKRIAEARLVTDITADLFTKVYARAVREIAAVMYYSELARKEVERARWYCEHAGVEKPHIPTPTQAVRNTKFATEDIAVMCNLPDIYDQEKSSSPPPKRQQNKTSG